MSTNKETEADKLIKILKRPTYQQMYDIVNHSDFVIKDVVFIKDESFTEYGWTYTEFVQEHKRHQSDSLTKTLIKIRNLTQTMRKPDVK